MIELDNCGRELHLLSDSPYRKDMDVVVQMVIKAPRGILVLFYNEPPLGSITRKFSFPKQTRQCKVIKAFMKEHQNE